MPPHSQCLPNGMPSTSGPSCGPINGGSSILNNHQNQLGPGISPHPGHMNGLGGPGMLPNGPSGTPHLPIPTPPIHTSNPNSILGGGPNGPHQLPSTMLGGPGNSNNGVGGLPPLPSMSSGKIRHIFLGIRIDAKAIIQKQYHIPKIWTLLNIQQFFFTASSSSVSGVLSQSTIQSSAPISSPQLAPLPPMSAPVGPLPPMVS